MAHDTHISKEIGKMKKEMKRAIEERLNPKEVNIDECMITAMMLQTEGVVVHTTNDLQFMCNFDEAELFKVGDRIKFTISKINTQEGGNDEEH